MKIPVIVLVSTISAGRTASRILNHASGGLIEYLRTTGISMKFFFASTASCNTFGAPSIRAAMYSTFSSHGATSRRARSFFANCSRVFSTFHGRSSPTNPAVTRQPRQKSCLPSIMISRKDSTTGNNRAENSYQPTRERERRMRGFESAGQAQIFLSTFGVIASFFRPGRHLLTPRHYREIMRRRFTQWRKLVGLQPAT